ncbi:MAG: YIP1 family protein [Cereibacter sphaeroides]|uniref:YIP1 family protein n=1 Tax=Cereibacter sphaeroides TaxID=1063 RepID=A0A2W5SID3_CERSP|nr:MAG: YIP1 family protein [Cereibacter sphaeroides]
MAITSDIVESYRRPRAVLRRKLSAEPEEGGALALLMGACVLIFISQWPALARAAATDPSIPLDARLGGALMATLFLLPLIAYGIAALSHLVARALGGRGSYLGARLALFWALLAISPLMLLNGLARALLQQGAALTTFGLVILLVFLVLWTNGLIEAERS